MKKTILVLVVLISSFLFFHIGYSQGVLLAFGNVNDCLKYTGSSPKELKESQHLLGLVLKTELDEEGVYYRYFPLHLKTHKIAWSQVDSVFIRTYRPLREYGGWGLRYTFRHGKAFSAFGNIGVQLILKNKKKVLISTHKQEEFKQFLAQLAGQGLVKTR
jgi:hypothetical protein